MQDQRSNTIKAYFIALIILLLWMLGPMLPWVLDDGAGLLWRFQYRYLCHQIPDRCIRLHGIPMAVCERCFGIYAGLFAGGVLYWPLKKWDELLMAKARWLMGIGALVVFIHWAGPVVALWEGNVTGRVITGFVFGIICGYYATKGLSALILEVWRIKWRLLFQNPNRK